MNFQSRAVGEGGGHPEREDPPSGRHAEEPAEESQAHDRAGEAHMCQANFLISELIFVQDF